MRERMENKQAKIYQPIYHRQVRTWRAPGISTWSTHSLPMCALLMILFELKFTLSLNGITVD